MLLDALLSAGAGPRIAKAVGLLVMAPSTYLLARHLVQKLNSGQEKDASAEGAAKRVPKYGEKKPFIEKFLYLPPDCVGPVLGRFCKNVRKIEFETRTFINVVTYGAEKMLADTAARSAYEDWTMAGGEAAEEKEACDGEERHCFLRVHAQTPEQIELVELAVAAFMEDSRRRRSTIECRIPANTVGYVIGRKGENVRRINAECRVFVRISQTGADFETVFIEGSPEGCTAAEARVMASVDRIAAFQNPKKEMTVEEEMAIMYDEGLQADLAEEW